MSIRRPATVQTWMNNMYEPNEQDYLKAVGVIMVKINPDFKQSFVQDFAKGKVLVSEHFTLGMQIRNAIRMSKIYPKEEELPEHFYDQTWQILFLAALNFNEDELNEINIEAMLTSDKSNCRWTGQTLLDIYKNKKSLTELCAVELLPDPSEPPHMKII